MTSQPPTPSDPCTIFQIPQTPTGLTFYLTHYRPFRLRMLREDQKSFSRSYAAVSTYPSSFWEERFTNPIARTFVALAPSPNPDTEPTLLSCLTLCGPCEPLGTPPMDAKWEIHGMWTAPEYRRRGFGREVVKAAMEWAGQESRGMGRGCVVRLYMMGGNEEASAFYESVGMEKLGSGHGGEWGFERRVETGFH